MINPESAKNIVKLAALAAVVDGQASDKEKDFIVNEASHMLRISPDEVRLPLDIWIGKYQAQGAANNPGIAIDFALEPLKSLTLSEKHLAFYICQYLVNIDKEAKDDEISFILKLNKLTL